LKRLLVLNPNTTEAMTRRVVAQVERVLAPGWTVRGATATVGAPVIADRASFAAGAQAALQTFRAAGADADAVLLACFGDPGLAPLRALAGVPVAGMADSALREADALARPFRVVTAGPEWPAMLREGAAASGLDRWLEQVVALETTGLAVAREPDRFRGLVQEALDRAAADGIATVVLGGAGFAGMARSLRTQGRLIDGLEAAVRALMH
jgi:allantoin racemase